MSIFSSVSRVALGTLAAGVGVSLVTLPASANVEAGALTGSAGGFKVNQSGLVLGNGASTSQIVVTGQGQSAASAGAFNFETTSFSAGLPPFSVVSDDTTYEEVAVSSVSTSYYGVGLETLQGPNSLTLNSLDGFSFQLDGVFAGTSN